MPMNPIFVKNVAVLALLSSAACSSLDYQGIGRSSPSTIQPAPTTTVQTNELPPYEAAPLPPQTGTGETLDNSLNSTAQTVTSSGNQVAAATSGQASGSVNVDRSDLLGSWKLASNADNCQLILTLTSWEGGNRATTRGCGSPELQAINAWTLEGRQITLKQGTAPLARLFPTTATQFNGLTLSGGAPISFFR